MDIRKAVITAADPGQRTLPLQTLVDRDGKTVLPHLPPVHATHAMGAKVEQRWAFVGNLPNKPFLIDADQPGGALRQRLLDMLVWNISDHTDQTMFDGVEQLPAGHFILIDLAGVLSPAQRTEFCIEAVPDADVLWTKIGVLAIT